MNNYIEKFKSQLPLLKYCDGPGTQEDGIIRHLLSLLDLKSNYFVELGQRSLGGGTLGRIAQERQASLLNIDSEAVKDEVRTPLERWPEVDIEETICIAPEYQSDF